MVRQILLLLIVLKSDLVVAPEVVSAKYMHCLILQILIKKEGETIKNWALQLLYSQWAFIGKTVTNSRGANIKKVLY